MREWHDPEGWGVLDSEATPGGCWVHFSAVDVPGIRRLAVGDAVRFTHEAADQDGHAFRATAVRPDGQAPSHLPPEDQGPSAAYCSRLSCHEPEA